MFLKLVKVASAAIFDESTLEEALEIEELVLYRVCIVCVFFFLICMSFL